MRLTTDRAFTGRTQRAGRVYDLPEDEARRLIEARQAEQVEAATVAPPENAMRRHTPAPRKGR